MGSAGLRRVGKALVSLSIRMPSAKHRLQSVGGAQNETNRIVARSYRYRSCNEWKHYLFFYLEPRGPASYLSV
jgi:hypothetical protein